MTTEAPTLESAGAVAPGPAGARKGEFGHLLLISFAMFMATAVAGAFAPAIEAAKASMHLTDVQIGLLAGLASALPTGILAIPMGRLIDRVSRVKILIVLSLIWSAGALLHAFAQSFEMLFVARMLAAFGMFSSVPVGISLAADLCRPEHRGRSVMMLSLGNKIGAAAAFMIGAPLLTFFVNGGPAPAGMEPWRAVQLVFGVISIVASLPLLFLREPARQEIAATDVSFGVALKEVWDRRGFLFFLFLGQVGVVMADYAAMVWAAPVLARNFGMDAEHSGAPIGLAILASGIIGSVVGGFAADWGQKMKYSGGILMGAVVMAALAIPAALFPVMPDAGLAIGALALLLFTGAAAGLITATTIAVRTPNEIRGVCLGAFIVGGALIGLGVAPLLVSYGSLMLGGEQHLAKSLAIVGVAINVVSFLAFLVAMLRAPRAAVEA